MTTTYLFSILCAIIALQVVEPVAATLLVNNGIDLITYRAPYIFFGAYPFNITAELVLITDYDSCDELPLDMTNKIVVSNALSECVSSETESGLGIRASHILHSNASVSIL